MNHISDRDAALSAMRGSSTRNQGAGALSRAVVAFKQWRSISRSRRELATFDDYQLRDIGLSRSQAQFESGKSFLRR